MAQATATSTTTVKPVELADSRFKAVRRVKNRFKAHANREIGRHTRAVAASKDATKSAVNAAKAETWAKAIALIDELG